MSAFSDTSIYVVRTFEQTGRVVPVNGRGRAKPFDPVVAIRATLEAVGIEFTEGDEPGVKLRKRDQ